MEDRVLTVSWMFVCSGLDVDGIYRVSGNLAVIQRLRHRADHGNQASEWLTATGLHQ